MPRSTSSPFDYPEHETFVRITEKTNELMGEPFFIPLEEKISYLSISYYSWRTALKNFLLSKEKEQKEKEQEIESSQTIRELRQISNLAQSVTVKKRPNGLIFQRKVVEDWLANNPVIQELMSEEQPETEPEDDPSQDPEIQEILRKYDEGTLPIRNVSAIASPKADIPVLKGAPVYQPEAPKAPPHPRQKEMNTLMLAEMKDKESTMDLTKFYNDQGKDYHALAEYITERDLWPTGDQQ